MPIYDTLHDDRMPPKKRRKTAETVPKRRLGRTVIALRQKTSPTVGVWKALGDVAVSMAKCQQQREQFAALLRQVAELTEHEATQPEKPWNTEHLVFDDELAKDIHDYVLRWLAQLIEHRRQTDAIRTETMHTLRAVDVLDDDALKRAAQLLTETETKLVALQQVEHRWSRVVRFRADAPGEHTLVEHTREWVMRWLGRWKKLQRTIDARITQFKKYLDEPLLGLR